MSIVKSFGRIRNLVLLASAGLAAGLAWADQVETVRVCEEANPSSRCDGADARFQHASGNPNVGFSITMGYVDNDDFIDLVIGAPQELPLPRVYVIYGSIDADAVGIAAENSANGNRQTLLAQADVILEGEADSEFGHSVAVGPIFGGANPVIVGAPQWSGDAGVTRPGRASVVPATFWGTATRPSGTFNVDMVAGVTHFSGEADADEAGYAVGIGPVLAAGAADFVVTARRAADVGALYAVTAASGSINLSAATIRIGGNAADGATFPVNEGLGEFIAIADFANNGGTHEVAVSAVGINGSDSSNINGHVYVFSMLGAPTTADAAHRIDGGATNDFFGFSFAAGDVLAGTGTELIVGAIYADRDAGMCNGSVRTNVGAAYIFDSSVVVNVAAGLGGPRDVTDADVTYRGQYNWDEFGFALAVGNTDHSTPDSDLAISARRSDRNQNVVNQVNEGSVYLFEGPVDTITAEKCLDCPDAACTTHSPFADAVIYGGDFAAGSSDEIGFSIAMGDFNNGDDLIDRPGRSFDELAVSSVTRERVYLVSLQDFDNDGVRDVEDRDDDGDGYADADEDFNANGKIDSQESDPLTANRDVTVDLSTDSASNRLDCNGQIEVTVNVRNASPVLTITDPRLQITLPGAPFAFVNDSTFIDNQQVMGGFPFASARALTVSGAARTGPPLGPGQSIEVRFSLALTLKLDWATAINTNSGNLTAVVSLIPGTDPNELSDTHPAGIGQLNTKNLTINLVRPNLDIGKDFFLFPGTDVTGDLNAGEPFRYALVVTNLGNGPARNVVVTDDLPDYATLDTASVTVECASCIGAPNVTLPAVKGGLLVVQLDQVGTIGASGLVDSNLQAIIRFQMVADEDVADNTQEVDQATVAEVCLQDRLSDDEAVDIGGNTGNDPALSGDDDPNIDLVNVAEGLTFAGSVFPTIQAIGQNVTYTFTASTGTLAQGTVRLTNITFANVNPMNPAKCLPSATPVSGDTNNDGFLDWAETGAGAETWTFTCTYTAQGIPPATLDSMVRMTATTPAGNTLQRDVNVQLNVADIVLTGSVAPDPAVMGETATYTFMATTGAGTVALNTLSFANADGGNPAKCLPSATPVSGDTANTGFLDPGETWVFTCTYIVVETAGTVDSAVRISALAPGGAVAVQDDATVPLTIGSASFTASGSVAVDPAVIGETVTYTYQATIASGNAPLTLASFAFSAVPAGTANCLPADGMLDSGDTNMNNRLNVGETWVFSCTHVVSAGTAANSQVRIDAATQGGTAVQRDVSTALTVSTASLNVSGSVVPDEAVIGEMVTYSYDASIASGDVALALGSFTFAAVAPGANCLPANGVLTSGDDGDGLLEFGETWRFTCMHTVTAGTLASSNVRIAAATPGGTPLSQDVAVALTVGTAALNVSGSVLPDPAVAGDTVTYTFDASIMAGDVALPLGSFTFAEVSLGSANCLPADGVLASGDDGDDLLEVGETWSFTCMHTVANGTLAGSNVRVSAATPGGSAVMQDENVALDTGIIELSGVAAPDPALAGEMVTYTFMATTGSGTLPLDTIAFSDVPAMPAANCLPGATPDSGDTANAGVLDIGETWVFSCTFVVPGVDPVGPLDSNVRMTAMTTPGGATVTSDINVTLNANRSAPPSSIFVAFDGDEISWSTVTNATSYHLYRGNLATLRSTGVYTQDPATADASRFCFVAATDQTDPYVAAPGTVLFYLITADDGTMESNLGRNAAGDIRPNTDPCR